MDWKKAIIALLAVPFVLAAAIATMMFAYMLVPLMIVLGVAGIIYIVIDGNKPPKNLKE